MKINTKKMEEARGEFRFLKYITETVGAFDFPIIDKNNLTPGEVIPFNYLRSTKKLDNVYVHFFINDYQFERVWTNPTHYLHKLKQCAGVIGTDFSCYYDTPKALQIYNVYRNRCLDKFFQVNGIDVIPVASWGDESSFNWCFEGLPKHSTIAISSNGCLKKTLSFIKGFEELLKRCEPELIICLGKFPTEYTYATPIKYIYNNFINKIVQKTTQRSNELWAEEEVLFTKKEQKK